MPTWTRPGIYVQEIPALPPSVTEVASAVPAFVGYTEKADQLSPGDLTGKPARITSLLEFEKWFGQAAPLLVRNLALDAAGQVVHANVAAPYLLYHSLRLFYANGGGVACVVSVGGFRADAQVHSDDLLAGLKVLAELDEPTLLLCPDAALLPAADLGAVQQAMLHQCGQRKDRFAVLDTRLDDLQGEAFRVNVGNTSLSYGAAYTPWLQVHHDCPVPDKALRDVPVACPPSGAVAGVYAATDAQRGVWKAPANVALSGVVAPTKIFSTEQATALAVTASGLSINVIRPVIGRGLLVWGARTLAGNDNEWRYVSVRRLAILVEESLKKSTAWVVFEPNDANTWLRVRSMTEAYLTLIWRNGALAGAKADQAFFVRCGINQTMTALDVQTGRLIVELGLAVARPAEFIILRFSHQVQPG